MLGIKKLAGALARQQGEEEKESSRRLFQKLSMLLQRGNSGYSSTMPPIYSFLMIVMVKVVFNSLNV